MPTVVSVDPRSPDRDLIARAAEAMRAGGIVAYPTDTLYGLGVDPRHRGAVAALFAAKGRPAGQALPLIAADADQAGLAARLTPLARRLAEAFWPGPLTIVVPAAAPLAPGVAAADGTVAIRVPAHEVARALARAIGWPVTATSANRSGEPPASTMDAVLGALADRLAFAIDAGPAPGGPPSTIVDATGPAPVLVRAGVVPWTRVLESLE
ncbi:MAG TPA: L-threonylcarbamoyladenylate synthase [Vicinamibacterales bacterium]|nr:L-threonylcarbamoyladenylate synthase [Vicinamibacterales bacterium]